MVESDREHADGRLSHQGEAPAPTRDPLVGTVVNGKYRVESAIARGGMGRIYYATQVPLERPVALKVVQGDGVREEDSQFLKRFLQEASILARLQHPNVVTLFDYGRIEGKHVEQYFIAMEFLAGETLARRLKTHGRLSAAEALIIARQIVRGLREAHKRGVVHRDLKPSNIILVPEGDGSEIVKLVDFGIGKVLGRPDDAMDLTQDGAFVGTPRYMAPEQFEGNAFPASDLYALGTILFQALAGRLPFLGSTMAEFMVAKLAGGAPTIREVAPEIGLMPRSIETLVYHLLARNPDERPTMEELHHQLAICEEEVFGSHLSTHPTGSGPISLRSITPAWSSTPLPPSSGPASVPYGMTSRLPPLSIPRISSPTGPLTPAPMSSTPRPDVVDSPRFRHRAPLVAVLALFSALLIGTGIYSWGAASRGDASAGVTTPSNALVSGGQAGAGGGMANATSIAEGDPSVTSQPFMLDIESVPPGATVTEGDAILGTTPFKLAIERTSVANGPRTFVLKKDGFVAAQVVQGASDKSIRSVVSLAALAPEASSAVKSRPLVGVKPAVQAAPLPAKPAAPPAPPAAVQGPSDIRLKR